MNNYEQQQLERPTTRRWERVSILSALIGGGLMTVTGLALLSVLNEAEFGIVDPIGIAAMFLLVLALPALFLSERRWFGRLGKIGFGFMGVGWLVAAIALPVASYGPGVAFLPFLLGLLISMIGALVFGVSILRSDRATVPRLGAWLLIAALPVGVPFAIGFTTYVMGQGADPWAGPMLLYGLAWITLLRRSMSVSSRVDSRFW